MEGEISGCEKSKEERAFSSFWFYCREIDGGKLGKEEKMEGKKSRIGSSTNQVGSILRYDCHGFTIHLHSHIILHFLLLFLGVVSLV